MRVFPSVRDIGAGLAGVIARFPLVVASALGAMVATMVQLERTHLAHPGQASPSWQIVSLVGLLGMPWFFALGVYRERSAPGGRGWAIIGAGAALLAWYGLGLRAAEFPLPTKYLEREFVLLAGAHFLAAIAPFVGRREPAAFWRYNEILFLRYLLATLYTGALYLGLALALFSVDRLLGLKLNSRLYGHLWYLLAGGFHPLFFLAGVPRDFAALGEARPFSSGLRRFVQYVLLPLVAIYLAILYLYAGKILLTGHLPSGWVALPVMVLAAIGTLAALLLEPITTGAEFRWAGAYRRWFYRLLLPLLALLLVAIGRRIVDYGVTEERYFAVVLALWMGGIAPGFARGRGRGSIKLIPATLALLCGLVSFGPWDAFAVSYRSQWGRLTAELDRLGLLENGRVVVRPRPADKGDRAELRSIATYLLQTHDHAALDALMSGFPSWKSHGRREEGFSSSNDADSLLSLALSPYAPRPNGGAAPRFVTLRLAAPGLVAAPAGAQVSHRIIGLGPSPRKDSWPLLADGSIALERDPSGRGLQLRAGAEIVPVDLARLLQPRVAARVSADPFDRSATWTFPAGDLTWARRVQGHAITLVVLAAAGRCSPPGPFDLTQLELLTFVSAAAGDAATAP